MSIDMNQCVFGDRLKTRCGCEGIYLYKAGGKWPQQVAFPDGMQSYSNGGLVFDNIIENPYDITEILPCEQPAQKWPKPCCGSTPAVMAELYPTCEVWSVKCQLCEDSSRLCPTRDAAVESWDEGRTG